MGTDNVSNMGEIIVIIFAFGIAFTGLAGILLPFLPGVPLAWVGMTILGYVTDFYPLTRGILFVFLILTLLTIAMDFVLPFLGARKYNATKYGILGAVAGFIFGLLFLGPIGVIFGPIVGAFLGEMFRIGDAKQAMQSTKGVVLGFLFGSVVKIVLIFVMIGFMVRALFY